VSERSIDALAEIGSKRALPRLQEMLQAGNAKALPVVVRALGKIGDAKLVDSLLPLMARPEREIRIEAIQALGKLVDEKRVDQLRAELQNQAATADQTMNRMIAATLAELDKRMLSTSLTPSPSQLPPTLRPSQASTNTPSASEAARTMLISEVGQAPKQAELGRLDISTLKPGDIIEGRYKYIDRSAVARSAPCF